MNFLHGADFYWLLILIPGALILFAVAGARRRRLLRLVLGGRAEEPDAVGLSRGRRVVRFLLLLLTAVLLLTAAARPWWGTRPVPYSATGRDVLVLFDVSKSMLATDVAPSRLKHAQYLLKELVNANRGDRFGLVAFAGTSFLECPLTTDRTSFMQYVDELSPESIPVGGTNIERALRTAEEAFQAAEGNFRAILLITDGDELSGESRRAVEALRAKHIPLFILGLGDPDVPALVPEPDGGFKRDAQGELVKTRLAENALRELALSTGGVYVRSTALDSGLSEIERRIKALVPANVGSGVRSVPIERFPYFLIAAAVLLLGYFLLNDRRSAAVLVLLGLTVFPALGEPLPPNEKQQAADTPAMVDEAKEAETEDPVQLYNQALTWQQEGREEATALYEKAIRKAGENTAVGARSFFNLGVGRHRGARELIGKARQTLQAQQLDAASRELENARQALEGASELYAQALTLPDEARNAVNPGANLQKLNEDREMVETLLKKIEELKKQQQQAQQQTRQAKDQNRQDQQKQQQQQQNQQKQQNQQGQQGQQDQQDQQNQQGQQDQQNQQGQQGQQSQQNQQDQQQQQDQQSQQNQQQDQQSQQNQQQDQQNQAGSAAEQMEQARQATEELQRQAEDLQQQQLSEAAQRAAEDIRKAEEAKRRNRPEEADRHLQDALKNLGSDSNQDRRNDQQQQAGEQDRQQAESDQNAGEQEAQDRGKEGGQEQEKENEPLPEPGKSGGEPRRAQPGKLDKESAEKMLEIMADQEKDLREAIKRGSGARRIRVEKDW